jgi:hypothetical protein
MVKFPFEFISLKMFIAETYPFLRKRKFSRNEISRKFAHFRIISAFRKNGKNCFRFNRSLDPSYEQISVWDPHRFYADPDPVFLLNADPDPTCRI